ncbi:MAG: hypothetical protein K9J17_09760 [Flavobacteriales bacterium]|nr:hypothetical protein [Flavobacteriales bacterium]
MTVNQLKGAMKYYLKGYNDEGVVLSDSTVHNTVLSENDGIGNINSKTMYFHSIKLYLHKGGEPQKSWPDNWMELSVADLADKLLAS